MRRLVIYDNALTVIVYEKEHETIGDMRYCPDGYSI